MKRVHYVILGLFLITGLLFTVMPAPGETIEKPQMTAFAVYTATGNITALADSTSSWAVCKDWVDIPATAEYVKVCFYGYGDGNGTGDPCDASFNFTLYVADYGSGAQIIADANATIGAQQLSHNPVTLTELHSGDPNENYCWADTIGTLTEDWPGTPAGYNDGGYDGLAFERGSAKKIWCGFDTLASLTQVWCVAYGY